MKKIKEIDFRSVNIENGFWKRYQDMNRNITIHAVWKRFEETGRIEAFEFKWKEGMPNKPHFYWDSDVAKWMEGAAYITAKNPETNLETNIENLISNIEKNQDENGYFNIYFMVCEPYKRFTYRKLHELYCAGHLIEAAVTYYELTGCRKFLNLMIKYADYIERVFKIENSAKFITPGHEEIELALIRLWHCTGEKRYLDLSRFFVEKRGNNDKDEVMHKATRYGLQEHCPARKQRTAEGHAVRAQYLYCAMADLAYYDNDEELKKSCVSIYSDIINRKMYITGGLGSSSFGECFTAAYDLPNEKAYAETCAGIGLVLFSHRMLKLDNNPVYADITERILYNGMISGISLSGDSFFYENPLEVNIRNYTKNNSYDETERFPMCRRQKIFECSCCPPNLNRILASIEKFIYYTDNDTYYIQQFISSEMIDGNAYLKQTTDYPSEGTVNIETKNIKKLKIRIPSWCDNFSVDCEYAEDSGYISIINPKNKIMVHFDMTVRYIQANSKVYYCADKIAIQYGPIVYCAEGCDNDKNLHVLYINTKGENKVEYNDYFGCNIIEIDGYRKIGCKELYSNLTDKYENTKIKMIPYFAFANREQTDMTVWMYYKE